MTVYKIHILGVPQRKNEMHRQEDSNKIKYKLRGVLGDSNGTDDFPPLHHFTDCIEYFLILNIVSYIETSRATFVSRKKPQNNK